MCQSFEKVQEHLGQTVIRQKKYYDRGLKVRSYKVGSFIVSPAKHSDT